MSIQAHLAYPLFNQKHREFASLLLAIGQAHLFEDWRPPGIDNREKRKLLDDLLAVENSYPGGIRAYVTRSRKLLAQSREGKNLYAGADVEIPDRYDLFELNDVYRHYEEAGLKGASHLAVILVAGGVGERLGYGGIKIAIPFEIASETTYLKHYCSFIRALENRRASSVPLVIMTSPETDAPTREIMQENRFFDLRPDQVFFLKQAWVPTLRNNDAEIAKASPYELILKPHGHGDVHVLMHITGTASKLLDQGVTYLAFIQDTNAQVVNTLLPALGVSIKKRLTFNSVAVPRIPGEAAGAIIALRSKGRRMTINVEYNQLESLLRRVSKTSPSLYPANINALIVDAHRYREILGESQGRVDEFINPKYADKNRTRFKKFPRLETMMQDLPKLFSSRERVGVTVFERVWAFSANKNHAKDAASRHRSRLPPESAVSAESDFYAVGRKKLRLASCSFESGEDLSVMGVRFLDEARIVLTPAFALSISEVEEKIKGCFFSKASWLVLDGEHIYLKNLHFRGGSALIIKTAPGVYLEAEAIEVDNPGLELECLDASDLDNPTIPEYIRMRGYRVNNQGAWIVDIKTPGRYRLEAGGTVRKISRTPG